MAKAIPGLARSYTNINSKWQKATGGAHDPMATLNGKRPMDQLGIISHAGAGPVIPDPVPEVKPPVTMPDQEAIVADKKRSITDQLARRGRASTILTDQTDKLGG